MQHVVITGATGFIGRVLVRQLLAADVDVSVSVRHRAGDGLPSGLRGVHCGDVTVPDSLRGHFDGADAVIHLAGATLSRSQIGYDAVNVGGTRQVATECARQPNPPRLVVVSSIAALGATTRERPLRESDRLAPVSGYGRSKRDAEQVLRDFAGQVPAVIVRPPSVLGGEDPYLLDLFRWANRGWVAVPVRSDHLYSFVHVDDLSAALIAVAGRGQSLPAEASSASATRSEGIYHVADSRPMTFPEVALTIARYAGRDRLRTVSMPAWCCRLAGWTGELRDRVTGHRPIVNADKVREGLAGSWHCDAAKWHAAGLYAFPYSLEQRIRDTVDGYRRNGWLEP